MKNEQSHYLAPPLDTVAWLNSAKPLTLTELKGKVVVIHAFQMLCPGCVTHGIPQASAIYELYRQENVQVIGLHIVFEHHEVMTQEALTAFIHEYRIQFPVAIDRPSDTGAIPHTMEAYQMRGTPTLILLDKKGEVRLNHFGQMSDMQVGSIIGRLLEEESYSANRSEEPKPIRDTKAEKCSEEKCSI